MKLTKNKWLALSAVVIILAASFIWGGSYAKTPSPNVVPSDMTEPIEPIESNAQEKPATPQVDETDKEVQAEQPQSAAKPESIAPATKPEPIKPPTKQVINPDTGKDKYLTDPVPEGKPTPLEPEDAKITDKSLTCTLSVRCDVILDNLQSLDPEKTELVPEDGVIFAETKVTFYEGESVFNVLAREMKANKIHLEFTKTPIYNSSYIEGIGNLYEFDCGELSGWMYRVNDWFPNYGSSRYELKQDDKIEWIFTCDLGRDIGGYGATQQ